jgi:hypothetical protein
MDTEVAKSIQKILKKQGITFKTSTKVLNGDTSSEKVKLNLDAAKGGKEESVSHESLSPAKCLSTESNREIHRLTPTLSWSPSAAAPTPVVLVSRTWESRRTTAAVL